MIKSLFKGTIILTIAGLATRLIGFLYKIYLSNILGAKMLGIYQLVFPIFGLCFTLFGAGIQTAISQLVAANKNYTYIKNILIKSIVIALSCSMLLSLLTYCGANFIAESLLGESECKNMLKILAFAYPLCAVTVCINGCYYGMKQTAVPAITQLIEQIARVLFVYFLLILIPMADVNIACKCAVAGIAVGEGISMIYSLIMIIISLKKMEHENSTKANVVKPLFIMSLPLTGNKLVVALLHSVEMIIIPSMLKLYGMTSDNALSVYGVLTGMAMPFIMFPATITNSLSVLLIPTISEIYERKNRKHLNKVASLCVWGNLAFGILSTIFFLIIGAKIGVMVFNNTAIGIFIKIFSFLCPFMFVSTTISSIINGLGKTYITFFITITGLAIRILITVKLVPSHGISGYLISLLISQIIVTIMSFHYYNKYFK